MAPNPAVPHSQCKKEQQQLTALQATLKACRFRGTPFVPLEAAQRAQRERLGAEAARYARERAAVLAFDIYERLLAGKLAVSSGAFSCCSASSLAC